MSQLSIAISPTLDEMFNHLRDGELHCAASTAATVARKETELSPRQRQTLQLLLFGSSEKEVATRLEISVHTAHEHVKAIYKSIGVTSRGELMARFLRIALAERA